MKSSRLNKVSKSNGVEILGILYLIGAILSTGVTPEWITIVLYVFAVGNLIESIMWTFVFFNYKTRTEVERSNE